MAGWLAACSGEATDRAAELVEESQAAVVIPAKGSATTLDVASWNIEWFGDTGNGRTNETTQLNNARDVIHGADMDVWGVAEVVATSQFNSLKAQLAGYAGILANDSGVVSGSSYYGASEQKVGLLYKTSVATLLEARIILTTSDSDFGGRPPLQVKLRVTLNGATEDIVVIVLHSKCCDDQASWQRRANASAALKSYLDSTFPTQRSWVIGDFNDDVDTSIYSGHASPYANFVSDTARYSFPSKALSDAGVASTVDYPDMIDHHLFSNEVSARYLAGSAEIYRVDSFISGYGTNTSEHYPLLSRYSWGPGGAGGTGGSGGTGGTGGTGAGGTGGGTPDVILNEIGANEPGSNTVGEFVELVNIGSAAANLAGWTLSDASSPRHTFAPGTSLAAGQSIVVFGGSSGIPSGLTNAVAASTGGLNLGNSGDTVTLKNSSGTSIDGFAYSSSLASSESFNLTSPPSWCNGYNSGEFTYGAATPAYAEWDPSNAASYELVDVPAAPVLEDFQSFSADGADITALMNNVVVTKGKVYAAHVGTYLRGQIKAMDADDGGFRGLLRSEVSASKNRRWRKATSYVRAYVRDMDIGSATKKPGINLMIRYNTEYDTYYAGLRFEGAVGATTRRPYAIIKRKLCGRYVEHSSARIWLDTERPASDPAADLWPAIQSTNDEVFSLKLTYDPNASDGKELKFYILWDGSTDYGSMTKPVLAVDADATFDLTSYTPTPVSSVLEPGTGGLRVDHVNLEIDDLKVY